MGNVIKNILDHLERIENETNLNRDDVTKAFEKICPSIEILGNDAYDILDDILSNESNNEDMRECIFHILNLLEEIFIESLNTKNDFMLNDLSFILNNDEDVKNEIFDRSKIDIRYKRLFLIFKTFLKSKINKLYTYSNLTPKADRIIKGRTPKAKKPEQLKAEKWAQDIWEKAPTITQENMAYQLKDKLDLPQTIQTIIRWIRPFQPKKQ